MKNRVVKFGIVGVGNIGNRHAHHISANKDAALTALCDIDGEQMEKEHYSEIPKFNSYTEFLNSADVDIVNICTPNYLHKVMTIEALASGKHVICEKPMALSAKGCREMITASKEFGKKIFVVKQNRYNAPVREVKELIEKKALGEIFQVNINCFWNRNKLYYEQSNWRGKLEKDGGCLFTQFSHFVDIMYYLFGDITCDFGRTANFGHKGLIEFEDTGNFQLTTKAGALVSFNFTTCSYSKNMEGSIAIIAEKGSVKIGGEYLNKIDYQDMKDHYIPHLNNSDLCNDYGTYRGSMSNHDKVIENVIDTLSGKAEAKTTVEDGLKVVEIIENMYQKAMTANPVAFTH